MFMSEQRSIIPSIEDPDQKTYIANAAGIRQKTPKIGLLIASLFVIGLIILGSVSYITWNWLKNLQVAIGPSSAPAPSITTFSVQRSATYADLNFTILNAQYATSFPDDTIQSGPAVVRVNLHVTNKTTAQVSVIYYDVARLLAPKLSPAAPTNVHLSANPKPGSSETGWIDFPAAKGTQLASLKLQLGSVSLNETLVTIPFSGTFNPNRYTDKLSHQSLSISYDFSGNTLVYHLQSVDIRYSYQGTQCKAGDQYYVFNFNVDNPNGAAVSPGFGFDYIRLIIDGYNRPPVDNTLPYGFNAGAHGVGGRVVFVAPAGLTTLNIAFLLQVVVGQDNYSVNV
jgi:hypothetical protein